MIQSIGFGTYIFFACWCFLAAVFAYFFVPETTGLTLEQIDTLFDDNAGQEEAEIRKELAHQIMLLATKHFITTQLAHTTMLLVMVP